jgi:formylglycine-generating enzyme required for sulfatase activity
MSTEQEWEKAAKGTGRREYFWGNAFDKTKCNSNESGIGATMPVTKYPRGISPEGCFDMAGNVWEWSANWYDQPNNQRVIRGGSWADTRADLRLAYRLWGTPTSRLAYVGVRCAQDAP